MALGSSRTAIVRLVVRQALVPVVVGVVFGLLVALAATRVLTALLHGVSPHDPATLAAAALTLLATTAAAGACPAWRATRTKPNALAPGGMRTQTSDGSRGAGAPGRRRRARRTARAPPVSPPASPSRRPPPLSSSQILRPGASRRSGTGAVASGPGVEPDILPTAGGRSQTRRGRSRRRHRAGSPVRASVANLRLRHWPIG